MKKSKLITCCISAVIIITTVATVVTLIARNGVVSRAEEIKKQVDSLKPYFNSTVSLPSLKSSFPAVIDYEEGFKKLYMIGSGAIPQLLSDIESDKAVNPAFNISGIRMLLSTQKNLGEYESGEYSKDMDAYTPKWYAKKIREIMKSAPDEINTICNSNKTFEQKVEEINSYGVIALPILIDHIDKGETEWKECVALINYGMDSQERFDIIKNNTTKESLSVESKKSKMKQDFDYDEWINKNNNREDFKLLKDSLMK